MTNLFLSCWIEYSEARQFHFTLLANAEELEILFGGVLATGSKNWSSRRVIASGPEDSSTHSAFIPRKTPIN